MHDVLDVVSACRKAGISDKTNYYWRKKFGGMGRPQLSEMRALQKENARLRKIVAALELDKLILRESLDHLKPKAWRVMCWVSRDRAYDIKPNLRMTMLCAWRRSDWPNNMGAMATGK